uniref:Gibberellin 3-oxidase-like protein n=1 Tax=Ipomoea nil TaxID=35883 RepID=Q76I29_IPONI|nr:gibberellin 3-oxidase-like protein [Ipomoea nil]
MNQEIDNIIPMDFNKADQLPDSHTWLDDHSPVNSSSTHESVPLIDLYDPQAVDKIKMACETWGIFQVTNHGVPWSLLAQIEHQARRFFELAPEQKLRAVRSPGSLAGYGTVRISKFFDSQMWSEGFTVAGSPLEHARQVWPQDYSDFCSVIDDYQEKMRGLAEKIAALMFKSLGLSPGEDVEWFEPNGLSNSTQAYLQMNWYPKCPDPTRAMGLAQHTDTSLVTLLYQTSNIRGLQVYGPNLNWVDVKPISDAIVVNLGDLMQIISNGRFKSVLHRAIVSEAHNRISVGYFFGSSKNVEISPSLKLIKGSEFPMYKPISWNEYLDIKNKYFNKSLEMIGFNSDVEKSNALASGDEAPLGSEVEAIKV